ncbi:MAG: biopolymer transporter ExbD [Candidatus Aminicenantes bacterium]|nr:biopolymer transporter ExbD [Candidatus Aminicenantes bacterium]NIM83413.1 biopolymer transporter ExbD [Candidatus Aminicenantes bacterium]NIN24684.1 biopolymer transporter ExbD [Candidatus Aminicenantes bacterium]NIN48445.1 biopolymer transporter ExbD [Candidatus Aminicenantes bacterium]NIN91342.1 biopolymer transporter ExbD [Candidatus Aminicenantes bacterium]
MSVDVSGSATTKSEPNVVPLCDILLVLLIIFMVITPVAQKGIDIQLPEQSEPGQAGSSKSGVVLTLERDRSVKLNQDPVPMDLLETRLRELYQRKTDKTIFIRADKSVLYRDVLRLIDIAKGSGIEVLGVMTQTYETGSQ